MVWDIFWHIIIILAYLFTLYLLIFVYKPKNLKLNLKLEKKDFKLTLVGVIGIVTLYLLATFLNILTPVPYERSFLMGIIAAVYFILLIAPVEELIFRGVIQNFFVKKINLIIGIIFASAIFGLAHLPNGATSLSQLSWSLAGIAFIGGLIFGYIFYKTKSIINPIIVHTVASLTYYFFFGGLKGLF